MKIELFDGESVDPTTLTKVHFLKTEMKIKFFVGEKCVERIICGNELHYEQYISELIKVLTKSGYINILRDDKIEIVPLDSVTFKKPLVYETVATSKTLYDTFPDVLVRNINNTFGYNDLEQYSLKEFPHQDEVRIQILPTKWVRLIYYYSWKPKLLVTFSFRRQITMADGTVKREEFLLGKEHIKAMPPETMTQLLTILERAKK